VVLKSDLGNIRCRFNAQDGNVPHLEELQEIAVVAGDFEDV
jgi:hypothetical protein